MSSGEISVSTIGRIESVEELDRARVGAAGVVDPAIQVPELLDRARDVGAVAARTVDLA